MAPDGRQASLRPSGMTTSHTEHAKGPLTGQAAAYTRRTRREVSRVSYWSNYNLRHQSTAVGPQYNLLQLCISC